MRTLRALGILDGLSRVLDPYESDIGRLRSEQRLAGPGRDASPAGRRRCG